MVFGVSPILLEAGRARTATQRLRSRLADYHAGRISFAEFEASLGGWIPHVAHADSWGLRRHMLEPLVIRPAEHRRALAGGR